MPQQAQTKYFPDEPTANIWIGDPANDVETPVIQSVADPAQGWKVVYKTKHDTA